MYNLSRIYIYIIYGIYEFPFKFLLECYFCHQFFLKPRDPPIENTKKVVQTQTKQHVVQTCLPRAHQHRNMFVVDANISKKSFDANAMALIIIYLNN